MLVPNKEHETTPVIIYNWEGKAMKFCADAQMQRHVLLNSFVLHIQDKVSDSVALEFSNLIAHSSDIIFPTIISYAGYLF